jgi:hypothetical protein
MSCDRSEMRAAALSRTAHPPPVCSWVQSRSPAPGYSAIVYIDYARAAVAPVWIVTAGLVGLFGNVTTLRGAALVLGLGLIPPMLLMFQWRRIAQPAPAIARR